MSNGIGYLITSDIVVKQGDDRKSADGLAFSFSNQSWSYSIASIQVIIYRGSGLDYTTSIDKAGSYNAGTKTVSFELTAIETKTLSIGISAYSFSVIATLLSGSKITLASGNVNVVAGIL
jgi:hypothetical protein